MEKHSIKFNNKQIVLSAVNKIILFFKKQRWHLIDVCISILWDVQSPTGILNSVNLR